MSLRDYFSNNKIFTGTEKPTQGKFDVGDIIVNIGPNSAEEPMWICVEAGTPGVWELCSGVNEEEIADIVQANALSAVEYTDGVDIQIDGGEIGNMNELQTTDKSSIVGAINELFQSANNGKELIANAIGEPLSSEDTFSAMSDKINDMKSNLKQVLTEEGVSVTEEDDMSSLISKVDEEFENKNTEMESNKGLDIISATELPATGRENQICVITDNPVDNFLISSLDSDFENLSNDTILLQTAFEPTTCNYTTYTGNMMTKYYFASCSQDRNIIPSYVYNGSQWNELTPGRLYFIKDKKLVQGTVFGDIYVTSPPYVRWENGSGLYFYATSGIKGTYSTTINKVNLSAYRKVHVVASVYNAGLPSGKALRLYYTDSKSSSYSSSTSAPVGYIGYTSGMLNNTGGESGTYYTTEITFDISSWTGEHYLGFYFYSSENYDRHMYITEVYFY